MKFAPAAVLTIAAVEAVRTTELAHEKHGYLRNEGGGASAISFARDVLGRRLTPEALDTCGMQAHCFIFTESPYCTGSCNCQYQVCIDYNKVSGCKDAVSHAIRTRDCLNVTCNKVEPFGEASGALCEVVEKGGTARFVIKDGSHCIVDTFDVPGWQCQPGTEPFPCGGEGNFDQECVWWHTVPESFPLPTFDKPYPEDVNSNCSNIPDPPTVTAKDACGNVVSNVVFSTTTNGTVCTGQNITRTWTATDTCDGSATLTQHVIVAPDTDGPNVVPPPDTTLDCPADLDPGKTGRPTVSDLCSNVGSITYLDAEVPGNCTGNKAIERTWKALDDCGNAGIATQHIVVRDITKPTITCPADADNIDCNGGCSDVGCLGTAIATDKCDATPTITHTDTRIPLENPTHASTDVDVTISRTWTATDSCGNQHTCVQTIRTPGILTELQVVKKTNGAIDPTKDWVVTLSFDSKAIASGTTLNLPDSAGGMVLDWFIDPSLTFTVCESTVPAGWSALWTVNGNSVVPSNPDGPTENVGRLCYDLHPASLGVTCHDTITLDMNNIPPQGKGCPRTPGYWKNWNTCSKGNQAETAKRNGGAAQGFYLVDDLLRFPGTTTPRFVWDDMIVGDSKAPWEIDTCLEAVAILNTKTQNCVSPLVNNKVVGGDALVTLAKHLLTAQLNRAAGACVPKMIRHTLYHAELLLDGCDYSGCNGINLSKCAVPTTRDAVLALANTLDQYNNGKFCPGCGYE